MEIEDIPESYLFCWDDIEKNDYARLIEILRDRFDKEWVEIASVEIIDDGNTVRVYNDKESIFVKLSDDKTTVKIELEDSENEFPVKSENGKLNIYSNCGLIKKYNVTCPFCNQKYTTQASWEYRPHEYGCHYSFDEEDDIWCEHLLFWDNRAGGVESEIISNLDWYTRGTDLPFGIYDVFKEVVNNDDLPKECEVKIRTFYDDDYSVFVFGNKPETILETILDKTLEEIKNFIAQNPSRKIYGTVIPDMIDHENKDKYIKLFSELYQDHPD